jgi:hypothetical protein
MEELEYPEKPPPWRQPNQTNTHGMMRTHDPRGVQPTKTSVQWTSHWTTMWRPSWAYRKSYIILEQVEDDINNYL